jgi:hypothetical protein
MPWNTAMIVYGGSNVVEVLRAAPVLDRPATRALVQQLFPDSTVENAADALLLHGVNPAEDLVYVGCFRDVDIVCSWRLVGDRPSNVANRILGPGRGRTVFLHAMQDVVDWFAYGIWVDGTLVRALSAANRVGVVENIGEPLPFEAPYWENGSFVPTELGVQALHTLFGFRLEGMPGVDEVDPEVIPLVGYRIRS